MLDLKRKAQFYNETAWMYDKRYGVQQSLKHSVALLELPVERREVVVDLGCGTGDFLKRIKNVGCACLGIDFSYGMILEARKKYSDLDLVLADVHHLPLRSSSCDKFFAITLLQNVDSLKLFKEVVRVCHPGSWGVVSTISKKAVSVAPFSEYIEKVLEVDEDVMVLLKLPE
ncbi:MAG: class I SAM-dependent methyltransferase [Candidatus Jordarchaeales archaeon]|nr:class I SAM-dependent methyltransferase [Candidatus Jordarchaeia archaeon]